MSGYGNDNNLTYKNVLVLFVVSKARNKAIYKQQQRNCYYLYLELYSLRCLSCAFKRIYLSSHHSEQLSGHFIGLSVTLRFYGIIVQYFLERIIHVPLLELDFGHCGIFKNPVSVCGNMDILKIGGCKIMIKQILFFSIS